jgi:hypothetical protein
VDAGYGVRLSQSERPEFLGDGEREEEGEGVRVISRQWMRE